MNDYYLTARRRHFDTAKQLIQDGLNIYLEYTYFILDDINELSSKVDQLVDVAEYIKDRYYHAEYRPALSRYIADLRYFADMMHSLGTRLAEFTEKKDELRWLLKKGLEMLSFDDYISIHYHYYNIPYDRYLALQGVKAV